MVYLMLSILEFRGLGYTNLYGWVNPNPFTLKLSYFGFWKWKFQYIYYLVVVQIDSWVLLGNIPQCNSGLLSLWSRGRPRSWLRHWITFLTLHLIKETCQIQLFMIGMDITPLESWSGVIFLKCGLFVHFVLPTRTYFTKIHCK